MKPCAYCGGTIFMVDDDKLRYCFLCSRYPEAPQVVALDPLHQAKAELSIEQAMRMRRVG